MLDANALIVVNTLSFMYAVFSVLTAVSFLALFKKVVPFKVFVLSILLAFTMYRGLHVYFMPFQKPFKRIVIDLLVPMALLLSLITQYVGVGRKLLFNTVTTLMFSVGTIYLFLVDNSISWSAMVSYTLTYIVCLIAWSNLHPARFFQRLVLATMFSSDTRELTIIMYKDLAIHFPNTYFLHNQFTLWIILLAYELLSRGNPGSNGFRVHTALAMLGLAYLAWANIQQLLLGTPHLPYRLGEIVLRLSPIPFLVGLFGSSSHLNIIFSRR